MEGLKQRRPVNKEVPVRNAVDAHHRDAFPPPAPFVSRSLSLTISGSCAHAGASVDSRDTEAPSVLKAGSLTTFGTGASTDIVVAEEEIDAVDLPEETLEKKICICPSYSTISNPEQSTLEQDDNLRGNESKSSIACAHINKAMKGVVKASLGHTKTSKKRDKHEHVTESDDPVQDLTYATAATKAANTAHTWLRSLKAKMLQGKNCATMLLSEATDVPPKQMSEREQKWQRRYLETLTNGTQTVRSLKVMFLGHARNGKTSTLRALVGLPFNPNEESTQGAKIWSLENKMVSAEETSWKIMQAAHTDHLEHELVEECAKEMLWQDSDNDEELCTKMEEDLLVPLPNLPDGLKTILSTSDGRKEPSAERDRNDTSGLLLSTWDCAGQTDYYVFVHLFLSELGIYMLCTDFSIWCKDIEERREGMKALDFWIGSLYTFAPEAMVIIIATKVDMLTAEERLESKIQLQEHLEERLEGLGDFANNILLNDDLFFFPVSNRTNEGIDVLRTAVEAAALKTLAKVPKNIPHRWVHLLAYLKQTYDKIKEPGKRMMAVSAPCITVETLRMIAKQCGFSCDEDVDQFLKFFQSIGLLLHDNVIVCYEPQWLLQAITKVCGAKLTSLCAKTLRETGVADTKTLRRLWPRLSATDIDIILHFLERYRLVVGPFEEKYYVPALMKIEPPLQLITDECTEIFFYCHLCLKELLCPFFPRLLGEACFVLSNVQVHHIAQNTFTLSFQDESCDYLASFELEEARVRLQLKTKAGPISPVVVERILEMVQASTRQFNPGLSFQAMMTICCGTLVCLDQLSSQSFVMCKDHEIKEEALPDWIRDWRRCRIEGRSLAKNTRMSGVAVHYLYSCPLTLKGGGSVSRLKIENELLLLAHETREEFGFQLSVSNLTSAHLREAFLRMPSVVILAAHVSDHRGVLVVEDDVGSGVFFPKHEFEQLPLNGVELVVLMACGSMYFLEYIKGPSVISCRGNVFDSAAQLFTRSLVLALSQLKAQGRNTASVETQLEAFRYAKSAVRTSPQPWAIESNQFHFAAGTDLPQPMNKPLGVSWQPPEAGLGRSVEDFVGREDLLVKVCLMFKRGRRLIRITGPPSIGKTAFGIMFAKYYRFPGRLFDQQLKLTLTESPEVAQDVCGADSSHVILYTGNAELPELLDPKVISFELPPLAAKDAAELFLLRVHRPIVAGKDLLPSNATADNAAGPDRRAFCTRDELLTRLPMHPLLRQCAGNPAAIISAAAKVTPSLQSLFDLVTEVKQSI